MTKTWVPLAALNTPALQNNTPLIQAYQLEVGNILHSHIAHEPLLFNEDQGLIRCRIDSTPPRWLFGEKDPHEELHVIRNQLVSIPRDTELLILVGNTIGYVLAHVIPMILHKPNLRVLVYEPTASRIRACLALLDIRSALATGRLHFASGPMTASSLLENVGRHALLGAKTVFLFHAKESREKIDADAFKNAYREESQREHHHRETLFQTLKETNTRQERQAVTRVLLIDCWPGAPGEAHLKAIKTALEKKKIQTRYLSVNRYQIDAYENEYKRVIKKSLTETLSQFQPGLVISYGYHAPKFIEPEWVKASGAVWLQTVSNIAYYDTCYYEGERTALIEKNLIPYFEKRGAHNPFFVPIMADYVAQAPARTNRQLPIVFVGNSLGLPAKAVNDFFASLQGREALIETIKNAEKELSVFHPDTNLYSIMRTCAFPQVQSEAEEYAIFRYLLCQGSAARRCALLESIAPLGLHLYGGDWASYLPADSPLRQCCKGYLPMRDEPKIFGAGHLFVNIHSVGHVTGPNMRFFNVAGLGGFQITDGTEFTHFLEPGKEAVFFNSQDDFLEKVKYYLAHIEECDEIRAQGQERVRKDWSYDRWVDMVFTELNLHAK